jgi:hypothetical protein
MAGIMERVRKGADRLTTHYNPTHTTPWVDVVDLDKLDILGSSRCVLGQLYRRYYDGLEALNLSDVSGRMHGFDPDKGEDPQELTNAWISYVSQLRSL